MLNVTFLLTLLSTALAMSEGSGSLISSTGRPRFMTPDLDSHVVVEVRAGNVNELETQASPSTTPRSNGETALPEGVPTTHQEPKVGPITPSPPSATSTPPQNSSTGASSKPNAVKAFTVTTKSIPDDLHGAPNKALPRNGIPGFHMVEPLTQSVLHAGVQSTSGSTTVTPETSSPRPVNGSTGESDTLPRDIDGGKVLTSAVPASTQRPTVPSETSTFVTTLVNASESRVSTPRVSKVNDKTITTAIGARSIDDTVGHSTGTPPVQNLSHTVHPTTHSKPPAMSTVAHSVVPVNSTSTITTESSDIRLRAGLERNGTLSTPTESTSSSSSGTETTMQPRAGPPASTAAGRTIHGTTEGAVVKASQREATSQATAGHDEYTTAAVLSTVLTAPGADNQTTVGLAGRHQSVTMPAEVPPFAQARAITAPDSEYIVPFAPLQRRILHDDDDDESTHDHFIRRGYCGKCQRELRFCVQKCFETHSCEAPVNSALTCPKIQIPCFPPYKPQPDECQSSADCEGLNHLCCLLGCSRKCVQGLVVPIGQH